MKFKLNIMQNTAQRQNKDSAKEARKQ